jgi:hypothetical protein
MSEGFLPPRLSAAAARSLAGARFWARLASLVILGPCGLLSLALLATWAASLSRDTPGPHLSPLAWLALPEGLAVLGLVYAARLGRFARGEPAALTAAFRTLRWLWILATVTYAVLLLVLLRSMGA